VLDDDVSLDEGESPVEADQNETASVD